MKFLLDTCVLSELRHPKGSPTVKQYIATLPSDDLFISAISIGEIVKGLMLLKESKKKRGLQLWLQALEMNYAKKTIAIDVETAHIWGEITARHQKSGKILHTSDGLIAATAIKGGLHLLTRNIADFENTGTLLINPWNM